MKLRSQKRAFTKFSAVVDDKTGLTMYERDGGLYLIIKKDLGDYNVSVAASEAPIINQFLKQPDPFEKLLIDRKVVTEELEPFNLTLHSIFGENKEMSLISIRIAIGSGENDYVTIDENDLLSMEIEPTITGVLEFFDKNESAIGLCDRHFDHERGNIILMEANIREPVRGVQSIGLTIMSSIQQRGLFMKQRMQYGGIHMYIVIKAESLNNDLLDFLKQIGVDWEIIFFRRELGIEDWIQIECENNSLNLKAFLRNKFPNLGYFDINNITRIAVINQLEFKVVEYMAELLDLKKEHEMGIPTGGNLEKDPLKMAEIIAAARLSCAYFGINKEIKYDKKIPIEEIQYFELELINL